MASTRIANKITPQVNAAERKREAGFCEPPRAHIGDELQAVVLISELGFVDEKPRIDVAAKHDLIDLVERHDDGNEVGLEQLEREVCARHHPRDGDAFPSDVLARHRCFGDKHRSVAITHRGPMRQEGILVG